MKIALITGANRGLGYATAQELVSQGYKVYGTYRSSLSDEHKDTGIDWIQLDITDLDKAQEAVQDIVSTEGRIDVLINNAGVLKEDVDDLDTQIKNLDLSFNTNTKAAYFFSQLVLPHMNKHGYGRIVNLSSGLGQLSQMGGGYHAYRISKAALNAVTKIAQSQAGNDVLVNSVCPGWVKTDMGGSQASRTIEEGIETIVWLATQEDTSIRGGFYRDKTSIAW